ncbi:Lrp/AsnC family transcriptional regulator [Zafaria sp. Z1313]|uniref:Lrp/AsnC family transcriptional regulator n=1 Tax=unclassified Zafaria TaxID=2828765 RepID=UPI002E7A74C1|nr:Lrp/AsnC family transcriptional regulator [Zafaria sp. J156]MEE1620800.1 Lrp/AsnC family transcriptional regulator [Zafaria sp. J156]
MAVDGLDARVLELFSDDPRMSVLEASRVLGVARATVQARLDKMQRDGVVTGWGPRISAEGLGFPVRAYCSLAIHQDAGHDAVAAALAAIPEVLELHTVSGESDLLACVVARSNADLQRVLDAVISTGTVVRSSSLVVLNTPLPLRTLPLARAAARRD